MYKRKLTREIRQVIKEGDSVLLLGPRQVGKTTLTRELFPEALRYDLADPAVKLRLARQPGAFLSEVRENLSEGGVLVVDEIQKVPALFDALQSLLDEGKGRIRAVLTGSSARQIKRGAVNTLPGRVLQMRMGPLSAEELGYYDEKRASARDKLLLSMLTRGQLPAMQDMSPSRVARHLTSYVQTYLEQEILADALTRDIGQFSRFLTVMAARSGKILNYSSLSQESGASVNTIKHHVEVLSDTLTAHLIPGFSLNDTKTWLSTPILLLFDLGVRNAAAERVIDEKALVPEFGPLFEQWVGLEILAWMRNREPRARLHYWRTTAHREIDWVVRQGDRFLAIEVKWSENWAPSDFSHLVAFRKSMSEKGYEVDPILLCRTPQAARSGEVRVIPPHRLLKTLEEWGSSAG